MKDNETKEIEKFGQLQENGILIMTIVGEIEGHQLSAQNAKTTKYEHMIPLLAKAEQDQSIKGILILINTIGARIAEENAKKSQLQAEQANAFEEDRKMALSKGMNGHIAKLIDVKNMEEVLMSVLR